MDKFVTVILLAVLAESIWETFKMTWQNGKVSIDRIGALVISIFICVVSGIDLFALIGIPLLGAYTGTVATGVLVSRGSNFVHDLIERFSKSKG